MEYFADLSKQQKSYQYLKELFKQLEAKEMTDEWRLIWKLICYCAHSSNKKAAKNVTRLLQALIVQNILKDKAPAVLVRMSKCSTNRLSYDTSEDLIKSVSLYDPICESLEGRLLVRFEWVKLISKLFNIIGCNNLESIFSDQNKLLKMKIWMMI